MDLWRLKIFCKVVEKGSFSKAAEDVLLSQPTVSSHIKDLEEYFGCRLIDRLGRRLVLTGAGELLYSRASKLLAMHDQMVAEMADYQGRVGGRLVIGGSTIPSGYILPGLIGAYRKSYPEVTVLLVVGDTAKIVSNILDGEVELGVVGGRVNESGIVQEGILTDEMKLVVHSSHPWAGRRSVRASELVTQPFIVRERGSGTLEAFETAIAAKGLKISDFNIVAQIGSTEAVIQGIKNGIGVSVLSSVAVGEYVREGVLAMVPVSDVDLTRMFYLTFLKQRSPSPAGRAFLDMVKGI